MPSLFPFTKYKYFEQRRRLIQSYMEDLDDALAVATERDVEMAAADTSSRGVNQNEAPGGIKNPNLSREKNRARTVCQDKVDSVCAAGSNEGANSSFILDNNLSTGYKDGQSDKHPEGRASKSDFEHVDSGSDCESFSSRGEMRRKTSVRDFVNSSSLDSESKVGNDQPKAMYVGHCLSAIMLV